MADVLKVKRGAKAKLPQLRYGEPAFVSDEGELYVGGEHGNVKVTHKQEVDALVSQMAEKANQLKHTNYMFNELALCKPKSELENDLYGINARTVYDWYDALLAIFPNRIQKTVHGKDDFGNDLIYYEIKSKMELLVGATSYDQYNDYNANVKQLILVSGVHGDEHLSVQGLYLNIKDILEEKTEYEKFIGDTTKIVVVPVVNPSGFNKDKRTNDNGVDINRNFDINWDGIPVGEGSLYYKGSSPNSEKETQFVISVCEKYKNTLVKNGCCVLDFHDFAQWINDDKRVFWFASNTPEITQGLMSYCSYGEKIVKEYYPHLTHEILKSDKYLYISTATDGNLIAYVTRVLGFKGCLVESCSVTRGQGGGKYFKEEQEFTYMNIYGALNFIDRYIGKRENKIINSLSELCCSMSSTLQEVVLAVPSKSVFTARISSTSTLRDCFPWNGDTNARAEGILTITKSTTNNSLQATITLSTVSSPVPNVYVCSHTENGLTPWRDTSQKFFGSFSSLGINSVTNTLEELIGAMPSGSNGMFSVTSADTGIYNGTPKTGDGLLTINKLVSSSNIVTLEFMRIGTNQEIYKTWGNKSLGIKPWKEVQYKTV